MFLTCWQHWWRTMWVLVEAALQWSHLFRWTAKGLSPLLSCGPFHFWPLHWQPGVESPCSCSHSHSMWPPGEDPACSERDHHHGELMWGSACPSHVALVHFRPPTMVWFRASLHMHVPGQGCCCRQWRGRPSWRASQSSAFCCSLFSSLPPSP